MANHLFNTYRPSASKFEYLQVQLIENVSVENYDDIVAVLWNREKYWRMKLCTLSHTVNGML